MSGTLGIKKGHLFIDTFSKNDTESVPFSIKTANDSGNFIIKRPIIDYWLMTCFLIGKGHWFSSTFSIKRVTDSVALFL